MMLADARLGKLAGPRTGGGNARARGSAHRRAEPLLLGAYSKRQDIPALETHARRKIVERTVAMYQDWDRTDPSAGKAAEAQRWIVRQQGR
jgi:hypothetical protein